MKTIHSIIVSGVVLSVAISAIVLLGNESQEQPISQTKPHSEVPPASPVDEVDAPPSPPSSSALVQSIPVVSASPDTVFSQPEPPTIAPDAYETWSTIERVPAQYQDIAQQDVDRRYLSYQGGPLKHKVLGDKLEIKIPHTGAEYNAHIVDIIEDKDGDRTITSELIGEDGLTYTVTMTVSGSALYAIIGTPNDVYEMQGHLGEGWIVASTSGLHMVDWSLPDTVSTRTEKTPIPTSGDE
ncbi:hypothetical protein [Agarivorans sp. Alg241-V36]|uniref:hypothetical protein n=1 Tax=Agarivorans sp. Alg241-V36 TaxID=2305992 RepID=UPI0013D04615|nr:hypothetical protein [Agarivorans sp. Alg241-V36]